MRKLLTVAGVAGVVYGLASQAWKRYVRSRGGADADLFIYADRYYAEIAGMEGTVEERMYKLRSPEHGIPFLGSMPLELAAARRTFELKDQTDRDEFITGLRREVREDQAAGIPPHYLAAVLHRYLLHHGLIEPEAEVETDQAATA